MSAVSTSCFASTRSEIFAICSSRCHGTRRWSPGSTAIRTSGRSRRRTTRASSWSCSPWASIFSRRATSMRARGCSPAGTCGTSTRTTTTGTRRFGLGPRSTIPTARPSAFRSTRTAGRRSRRGPPAVGSRTGSTSSTPWRRIRKLAPVWRASSTRSSCPNSRLHLSRSSSSWPGSTTPAAMTCGPSSGPCCARRSFRTRRTISRATRGRSST